MHGFHGHQISNVLKNLQKKKSVTAIIDEVIDLISRTAHSGQHPLFSLL